MLPNLMCHRSADRTQFDTNTAFPPFRRRSMSAPCNEILRGENLEKLGLKKRQRNLPNYVDVDLQTHPYNGNKPPEIEMKLSNTSKRQDLHKKPVVRQKKRKLRLSVSCPPFKTSDTPSCEDIHFPPPLFYFNMNHPNKNLENETKFPPRFKSVDSNLCNIRSRTCATPNILYPLQTPPITSQPASQDYIAFIKQSEDVNENAAKYIDSYTKLDECSNCLHQTKTCVSCCTCHWCLMGLCYHCVSKDDVGYNSTDWKEFVNCDDSAHIKIKRAAIAVLCLPCLPCLTCYPIMDAVLNMCLKFTG